MGRGFQWLQDYSEHARRVVIVTENPCPCYFEHVWNRSPAALVLGRDAQQVTLALETVFEGRRYRNIPVYNGPLTPTERKVLHHTAHGLESKGIALLMGTELGTVRNQISSLQHKLQAKYPHLRLENRTHLTMYYWGLWIPIKKMSKDV